MKLNVGDAVRVDLTDASLAPGSSIITTITAVRKDKADTSYFLAIPYIDVLYLNGREDDRCEAMFALTKTILPMMGEGFGVTIYTQAVDGAWVQRGLDLFIDDWDY